MNGVEQETSQGSAEENSIDLVNINSINFNKNHSVITVRLKTSAGINNVLVPNKVDTSSNGNIMLLHICKTLFPKITSEQLMTIENESIQLKMDNKSTAKYACMVESSTNKTDTQETQP